jgi:hypothetical protein
VGLGPEAGDQRPTFYRWTAKCGRPEGRRTLRLPSVLPALQCYSANRITQIRSIRFSETPDVLKVEIYNIRIAFKLLAVRLSLAFVREKLR